MEQVSAELLTRDISQEIEKQVEARVQEEIVKQKEHEKLYKTKEFKKEDWKKFDSLPMYQKLQDVLGDLNKDTVVDGLWKDLSPAAKQGPLRKFEIEFDLDNQQIGVSTKAKDNNGDALFNWNLDPKLGEIHQIKRIELFDPSTIVKEEVAQVKIEKVEVPATVAETTTTTTEVVKPAAAATTEAPAEAEATKAAVSVETEAVAPAAPATPASATAAAEEPASAATTPEWDDAETQRDLAFKIVYFFIALIILTFGLLYTYFKMDQKEQEQDAREKRSKGVFFGDVDNKTFFDFLAGAATDADQEASAQMPPRVP